MTILGNKRLKAADKDFVIFSSEAGADTAFTLNISNNGSTDTDVTVKISKQFTGRVGAVHIEKPGVFTSVPTLAVTGGATAIVSSICLVDAALLAAGSSYVAGDILQLVNAGSGVAATVKVLKTTAVGGISDFVINYVGSYTSPGTGTSASVTGGSGTGATFNLLKYGIAGVEVTLEGKNYTTQPTITVTPEGGAVLEAVLYASPLEHSIIEPLVTLPSNGVYERSGMVLSDGESLLVSATDADVVNVHAWGFVS